MKLKYTAYIATSTLIVSCGPIDLKNTGALTKLAEWKSRSEFVPNSTQEQKAKYTLAKSKVDAAIEKSKLEIDSSVTSVFGIPQANLSEENILSEAKPVVEPLLNNPNTSDSPAIGAVIGGAVGELTDILLKAVDESRKNEGEIVKKQIEEYRWD